MPTNGEGLGKPRFVHDCPVEQPIDVHVLVDGLATEFHRTGGPLDRQRRSARLDCVQNLPRTFRIRKIGTATQPAWLSPYILDAVRHPADSLAVIDDPSNVRIFKITNIKSTVRNHEMILPIVIGGCVPARRKTEQKYSVARNLRLCIRFGNQPGRELWGLS
jgi:hypothetical protein